MQLSQEKLAAIIGIKQIELEMAQAQRDEAIAIFNKHMAEAHPQEPTAPSEEEPNGR